MKIGMKSLAAFAAAASLAATPALAANAASSLSLGGAVRASSTSKHGSDIAPVVINIAILAALTVTVLVATSTDDSPDSP